MGIHLQKLCNDRIRAFNYGLALNVQAQDHVHHMQVSYSRIKRIKEILLVCSMHYKIQTSELYLVLL
jgi:hypothetical protein